MEVQGSDLMSLGMVGVGTLGFAPGTSVQYFGGRKSIWLHWMCDILMVKNDQKTLHRLIHAPPPPRKSPGVGRKSLGFEPRNSVPALWMGHNLNTLKLQSAFCTMAHH